MPPRNIDIVPSAEDEEIKSEIEAVITEETHTSKRPPIQIVWRNVFWMSYLHLAAAYGFFCIFWAKPATLLFTLVLYVMTGLGVTAGAHRLWSHRAYKAKLPLRILLAMWNSMAFQNDIIEWSRDHRVHHKYSETDADPHNAKRGFFFSHMGWLLVRKHPDVKEKGGALDVNDLHADPVCVVQRKLYLPSVLLLCFAIPTFVPWYYWGESAYTSFFLCGVCRYIMVLNCTWLVNSAAHMWGNKPYDKHINPVENFYVAFGAVGEGYHNYHHTFPYDYSTSEYGWRVNLTTMFIDFMAAIGQVSDRKKMSPEAIQRRRQRTGDGTSGFGYMEETDKTL